MFGRPGNEIALLRASLQGRTDAFETIVARYQSLVCAITYSSTGSVETSEELAQETFLKAWKSLHQLQDLTKFKAWLCSIARSTAQNWFRRRQRDVVGKAAPLDGAIDEPSHEAEPAEAAIMEEQKAVVAHALSQIPESLREPLVLFYREQKSIRQVAKQLGLSENAARQRIARGRSAMREQVAAMVETTIARTRPGKAFTVAVAGAIAATATRSTSVAAAGAGGVCGVATLTSSLAAKAITLAAGIAVVVGGAVLYWQRTQPGGSPIPPFVAPSGVTQTTDNSVAFPASGDETVTSGAAPSTLAASDNVVGQIPDPRNMNRIAATDASVESRPRVLSGSQPYQFQARGVLSGLVTDAQTGKPVVGAEVVLVGNPYRDTTDEHGFYSIGEVKDSGNYKVRVNSKEYLGLGEWADLPVVVLSNDQPTIRHFALQRGCAVDVEVIDEQGHPVHGVRVAASWLGSEIGDKPNRMDLGENTTDPNGRVTVGAVEPLGIEYRLTAGHNEYAPGHADVKLSDPNVIEYVQIILQRGAEAPVYVEYADGTPAKGARIHVRPSWWHGSYSAGYYPVGDEGIVALKHIVPGTYGISASTDPEGSDFTSWSFVTQVQLPRPEGEVLIVRLPMKSPQSLASIRGRILWASSEKPDMLHIDASGENVTCHQSVPLYGDVESFEIGLLEPGTYTLRFEAPGLEETTVHHVAAPTDDLEVVLSCQGVPHLKGSVVDARSGEPVDQIRARVIKLETLRGTPYTPQARWDAFAGGRFDLEAVGPGVYQVQAIAEGYAPTLSGPINTDEGTSVRLELTAGGSLAGSVVNEAGEPVDGATVIPLSTARGNMPSESDVFMSEEGAVKTVDGRFVFDHLPSGAETLKVTHPDYCPAIVKAVEIVAGEVIENPDIVLTHGAGIEGFAYDVAGRPQANVTVNVQGERLTVGLAGAATRVGTAVTDANGFYRIDGVPADRICYVVRQDAGRSLGVVQRACVPIMGQIVPLDLGGPAVLAGTLHKNGVPLPLTRLRISNRDIVLSRTLQYYGMTDDHGRFQLYGVPPGRYGLYYEHPGARTDWVRACIVEVSDGDVDLGVVDLSTTQVTVTLKCTDTAVDLPSWAVCLQEGTEFWTRQAGAVDRTASTASTRVIDDVLPGTYHVVARRDDVAIRKRIVVESTDEPLTIELDIPPAIGSVSGAFVTDTDQPLIMWNSTRTVTVHVRPRDGAFAIEHMPAGHYTVGNYFLTDRAPVLEFDLQEGEAKIVDIDMNRWSPDLGFLAFCVVGRDGLLLNHADVWLEGPRGRIDPEKGSSDDYRFIPPSGDYTLFVQCQGYATHIERVTLPPIRVEKMSQSPHRIVRLNLQ